MLQPIASNLGFLYVYKELIRVWEWNKYRNFTEVKPEVDKRILYEEIDEIHIAQKKLDKTIANVLTKEAYQSDLFFEAQAELIDAYCDTFFVLLGIAARCYYHKHEIPSDYLLDVFYETRSIPTHIQSILPRCFDKVCDANDTKPTQKDETGKIMKGSEWIDPKCEIKKIILSQQWYSAYNFEG